MISWRFVLVGAVLTAMAMVPKDFDARHVNLPSTDSKPMAHMTMMKVSHVPPMVSRSPVAPTLPVSRPLTGMKICVDPGHGGQARWEKVLYCGGTVGCSSGNTESDINLRVALCLRQYLEQAGATVIMTRVSDTRCTNGDKDTELDYRPNLANARGADLFISVHHNEGTNRDVNYTAVFYPSGTANSITLAQNISSSIAHYLGTPNKGALAGNYRVLSRAQMPSVIVEASFMSNPAEDRRLSSLSYNKMEAKAIATGILNYVRLSKGKQVDFNTLFSPIDDRAQTAQAIADASFVRRQIIERKSLFGTRVEEVTFDAQGNVTQRREITNSITQKARSKARSVASRTSKTAKNAVSKTKSVASKISSKAKSTEKSKTTAKSSTSSKSSSSKETAAKSSSSKSDSSSKSSSSSSKKVAEASKSKASSKSKKAVN